MARRSSWLIVLLLSVPALAQSTRSVLPPKSHTDNLPELSKQLGADDWKQRDLAQAEIVRIGGEALPALRDLAAAARDEEVRQRVLTAISKIEDDQLAGQSLISLDMTDATAEQIFAEISRQCFAPLSLRVSDEWRSAAPKLSIKVDRQPFWEVMRTICPQAGLHPEMSGETMVIAEGYQNELDGRVVINGPFLILLKKCDRTLSIANGQLSRVSRILMQITVMAEPKLQLVARAGGIGVTKALDNQDRPIPWQRGFWGMAMGFQMIFDANVGLTPETDAEALKALACELPVVIGLRPQTITIDNPLEAGERKFRLRGTDAVLGPMRQQGNSYQVQIECDQRLVNGGIQNINNIVRVFDAKGVAFRSEGLRTSEITSGGRFRGSLSYAPPAAGVLPDKVICSVHAEQRDITLQFGFSELPLP